MTTAERPPRKIRDYTVRASRLGTRDVLAGLHPNLYAAHGPDYRLGAGADKLVANPLSQFDRLLRELGSIPHLDFVTHRELVAGSCPEDRARCCIRHDIDADVAAALAQARIERRHGIRATHFVLHTAWYYGAFQDGVFERNEQLIQIYREIQDLGHEIALHADPLCVYQEFGVDGAQAVAAEIEWLRSNGLEIVGTVAHNSMSAYGAANFAAFRGRPQGLFHKSCPTEIEHNGKWAPLQTIDEAELGLEYEGNDAFWQCDVPVKYAVAWSLDKWWWEDEKRVSVINATPAAERSPGVFIDHDAFIERAAAVEPGEFLLLVVHPLYYGCRHSPQSGPAEDVNSVSVCISSDLGWETYAPERLLARSGWMGGEQEFQTIQVCDSRGMIAAPDSRRDEGGVLVLGGTNLSGSSVALTSQFHARLGEGLAARLERPVECRKLAHPGMGFGRLFAWYDAAGRGFRPSVVILGVGADEPTTSLPAGWRLATGFHPSHAPGPYLNWNGDRVEIVARRADAPLHRGVPRGGPFPSLAGPPTGWTAEIREEPTKTWLHECLSFFVETVRRDGVEVVIVVQECGESLGLWRDGVGRDERELAHARLRSCLAEIAPPEVPIIDPYAAFLDESQVRPVHWSSEPEWNGRAHRLAAESAVDLVASLLPDERS